MRHSLSTKSFEEKKKESQIHCAKEQLRHAITVYNSYKRQFELLGIGIFVFVLFGGGGRRNSFQLAVFRVRTRTDRMTSLEAEIFRAN